MKFNTFGTIENPIIIMLPGSFCPGSSMAYLYDELKADFYIIVPEYNGHFENSTFSTRRQEAAEIAAYIKAQHIIDIKMVYGQSMGAEIGIELIHQLLKENIAVGSGFFDGAPCIRLSKPYKAFMYFKFRMLIHMLCNKSVDEVMQWKFLNQFTNGDTESLRPMFEPIIESAQYLTDQSIKNESECCYTFDFPNFDDHMQKKMYFFYAKEEKAYKTCISGVKKSYPLAHYRVVGGYGHLTYSIKNTGEYIEMLKNILGRRPMK